MIDSVSWFVFFLSLLGFSRAECGYDNCPSVDPAKLNVHLVSHSHDDVGWLKTVDQYYLGANRQGWNGWEENQRAGVQYIIDTVIMELMMDPDKRFIQVIERSIQMTRSSRNSLSTV